MTTPSGLDSVPDGSLTARPIRLVPTSTPTTRMCAFILATPHPERARVSTRVPWQGSTLSR